MSSKRKRKPYQTSNMFGINIKTTTKEGKREYMRLYMRLRRMRVADVVGIPKAKSRKRK